MPDATPTAGILRRNPVVVLGLITASVIGCTDTLWRAVSLCFACNLLFALTIPLTLLIPGRTPDFLRILSYSLLGTLVYPLVKLATEFFLPQTSLGIYLPLLTVSFLLHEESDRIHVAGSFSQRFIRLACTLFGFDFITLLLAAVRELFGMGTLFGHFISIPAWLPSLSQPALGMIALGCLAAMFQAKRKEIE